METRAPDTDPAPDAPSRSALGSKKLCSRKTLSSPSIDANTAEAEASDGLR
jgi:hypothetical protein